MLIRIGGCAGSNPLSIFLHSNTHFFAVFSYYYLFFVKLYS